MELTVSFGLSKLDCGVLWYNPCNRVNIHHNSREVHLNSIVVVSAFSNSYFCKITVFDE